jgi:membrane associated rhomboid family serine protease
MTDEPGPVSEELTTPTCYRHAGRETYVRCQRCDRPICPDCMHPASVGFQCPDCLKEGARTTRQARTAYGGRLPTKAGRVTMALIGINAVAFLLVTASGGSRSDLLHRLWLLPRSACIEVAPNGRCAQIASGVADGAYGELVTSMFTHVQVWHIGFNMLALYIIGPQLETILGHARFLALYLLSGLVGSATVYWLADERSPTIGASGAIFGLMAALLVVAVKVRGDVQGLLTLVAVNVVITVLGASFISWQGHLGGFVGGAVLASVLVYAPRRQRTRWQVVGLAAVAAAVAVAVVLRTLSLT